MNDPKALQISVRALIFTLGVCLLLGGCETTKDSATAYRRTETPYRMAPLDEVRVVHKSGMRDVIQISLDGNIDLQGTVKPVKGMPVEEFRSLVRRNYPSAKEIEVVEFRPNRVTVLGEVFHQIHTDLGDGPMRVMDAIASANGFTPLANKRRVKLIRENAGVSEVWELDLRDMLRGEKLEQNLLLQPGDTITVPRNFL